MKIKEGVEALFLYAREGILFLDDQGEIKQANRSIERLYGYKKNELSGKKIDSLIPGLLTFKLSNQTNDSFDNPMSRSFDSESGLYGLRNDGTEFPIELSLSQYTIKERKFVIVFISDITQRKLVDEKLKQYSEELEKRTLILEETICELEKTKHELNMSFQKEKELSELKSQFVSIASHEFKTPLTTMMSSLSLVGKYSEQNDILNQTKHISKIKNSILNMTDIMNDFLSISKLDEGKMHFLPEKTNLKLFLDEIISEIQSMKKSGQILILVYEGDESVLIDRKLLRHVLFNLITNAIKFSTENKTIEIQPEFAASSFKISVKDQGIGIPEKDQQHLFERFFRAKNTTHIQGTGLGLSIVKNYIELMKGSLNYVSEENKGTTFTITIPLKDKKTQ